MRVLVTGGTGYIGSHTCVELLVAGFEVVVIDNLSNSKTSVLDRIKMLSGTSVEFHQIDICDRKALKKVFSVKPIDAVIHFAGLKAVGDSVANPLSYYWNNVAGSLILFEVMAEFEVKKIVFSSSATVYGNPLTLPIREDFPTAPTNPYGQSKLMIETILKDLHVADPCWGIMLLRYFNPVGAHESGLIGESPNGVPNNLLPYIAQVAAGKRPELLIFGLDYQTFDGSGVRDYIHIHDLALGHINALKKLKSKRGAHTYNLGTGQGYSVLQVIAEFEKAIGKKIPYRIVNRRHGDIAVCYSDSSLARKELDWVAEMPLAKMCKDAWNWQLKSELELNI